MKSLYTELIGEAQMHYVIVRDDDTSAVTPPERLERLYRPTPRASAFRSAFRRSRR